MWKSLYLNLDVIKRKLTIISHCLKCFFFCFFLIAMTLLIIFLFWKITSLILVRIFTSSDWRLIFAICNDESFCPNNFSNLISSCWEKVDIIMYSCCACNHWGFNYILTELKKEDYLVTCRGRFKFFRIS